MSASSCRKSPSRRPLARSGATIAIGLGIAYALAAAPAMADTQVRGNPQAASVQAQNATVEEILVALSNEFNVQFRSSADLNKRLTGTYEGSLQQVVSHVLKGYDFVVKSGTGGVEITLLGAGKSTKVIGGAAAAKSERRPDTGTSSAGTFGAAAGTVLPVPVATSDGPTPVIKIAEGPAPVPMPVMPSSGPAPVPVPRIGMGLLPAPAPPTPGAAPTPVPPMPSASSVLPPGSVSAAPAMTPSPSAASPPVPPPPAD